jgi:hypothetical protein
MSDADHNDDAVQRTTIAQHAIEFGAAFSGYCKIHPIAGEIDRVAQLRAPDGVSTSGGKHARQPLILEALPDAGGSITLGWVDTSEKRAQFRSYQYLQDKHQARYGDTDMKLEEEAYESFVVIASEYLTSKSFEVWLEDDFDEAQQKVATYQPEQPSARRMEIITVLLVIVVMMAIVFLFLR